jgi:FkbM family methyltransferase
MSFVSYAQNFEDVILWRALKNVPNGFYVDVGAGHPTELSVTKSFYDQGWHGINIEPNGEMYQLLVVARPRDINVHAAAGAREGAAIFYFYDRGVGIVADKPEIRAIFEYHGHQGHQTLLGQVTLDQILTQYPPPEDEIHFLKIDVEGYEPEVLQGLDLSRYRPWVIVGEASLPAGGNRVDQIWAPYLLDHGYNFACFDGLNCFYVRYESRDLHRLLQT